MVLLFGFLFSISTAFEIQLKTDIASDKLCKSNRSQAFENATTTFQPGDNGKTSSLLEKNDDGHNFNEDDMMLQHRLERSLDNDVLSNFTGAEDSSKLNHKTGYNLADVDHYVNDVQRDNMTSTVIPRQNHDTCSTVSDFYRCFKGIVGRKTKGKTSHMIIKLYGRLGIFR